MAFQSKISLNLNFPAAILWPSVDLQTMALTAANATANAAAATAVSLPIYLPISTL